MGNNCLTTRLQSSANNDSLNILNTIRIKHSAVSGKVGKLGIKPASSGDGVRIYVDNEGSFTIDGTPYTDYTLMAGSATKTLVFGDGDYCIYICNKYDLVVMITNGDIEPFANAMLTTEMLGYLPNITTLQLSKWGSGVSGNIESLIAPNLKTLSINGTDICGDISRLGEYNLTSINLYPCKINGDIFDYLLTSAKSGRSTVGDDATISWNNIASSVLFYGVLMYGDRGLLSYTASATAVQKATVYLGATSIAASTRVYCYGASVAEKQAWIDGGKVVIEV